MKSDLQQRAERAASQFTAVARRPIVIEFAGVPKAGKTSTLTQLQAFLKRCGFRTEVVIERASVCPIRDKKHSNFNVWTAATTLAQILEKTQEPPRDDDPHVLILDRGLFDSICWLTMMERLVRILQQDREVIEAFLRRPDWRKRISAVIMMLASADDSMTREQGYLPVDGGSGSIMNRDVLEQIRRTNVECAERLADEFRIYTVDTSYGETKNNPPRTAELVADLVLSVIEEHIKEEILALPKERVKEVSAGQACVGPDKAEQLVAEFGKHGAFAVREDVEADPELVQALPIVVVRNASGDVLRLRRREKSADSPLHDKIVIWAGGHVRSEDAANGDPILRGAIRELREELRLDVEPSALRMLGAVYLDVGGGTSNHVGIAYEWRAETDDVAVALSSAEFFERRGTSLSGSFVRIEDLARDVDEGKVVEPWSVELVRTCLAAGLYEFRNRLL